jgi:hypothetical protein
LRAGSPCKARLWDDYLTSEAGQAWRSVPTSVGPEGRSVLRRRSLHRDYLADFGHFAPDEALDGVDEIEL